MSVSTVAVVGAGFMGSGIAESAAAAGKHVLLYEPTHAPLERSRELLTASGKIYDGVNVENAAYGDSICAERTAAVKAVSEGEREFVAIAVSSSNGGSPCGSCRQVLSEFGLDAQVFIVDGQGGILRRTTVRALLPDAFGPKQVA